MAIIFTIIADWPPDGNTNSKKIYNLSPLIPLTARRNVSV